MPPKNKNVGRAVTIAEWAVKVGRAEESIRNHWKPLAGFPTPIGRRSSPGPGPGPEEYDEHALDDFRALHERTRRRPAPEPYLCPGDASERLTLGAIARRLGVDGRTITQYRTAIDRRTEAEIRGTRRYYKLGEVITALNDIRRGVGVSHDPSGDLRRLENHPRDQ